jgi:hypothetical protein
VQQPFTSLIVHGLKTVENRGRPTKYRGRVWVHASLNLSCRRWSEAIGGEDGPTGRIEVLSSGIVLPPPPDLPRGAVIGSVELYDCRHFDDLPEDFDDGGFANPGCYCWLLRDARPLAKPVPMSGRLGIWKIPAS